MKKQNFILPITLLSLSALSACTQNPSSIKDETATTTTSGTIVSQTGTKTESWVLTRTETLSYDSKTPEGMVQIEFSVSVKDGVITSASATPKTDKQASRYNQDAFAKELSGKVVGKKQKIFMLML